MKVQFKVLSACTVLALGAFAIPAAHAMTVSPVMFDMEIAPGAHAQSSIRILNDTKEAATYSFSAQNFVASGENGAQEYVREATTTDLASWVHLWQTSVTVQPDATADVSFEINVPTNAEPGGHYAAIFSTHGGSNAAGASSVGLSEQVGVLLLVRVPGDVREQASVESFRMAGGTVLDHLPANFDLRLRNSGSVHFRPTGSIVVKNMLGNTVARFDANPNHSAVLPNSVRRIETDWEKAPMISDKGFWNQTKNEWNNFALGKYTATAEMLYGSKNVALTATPVTFWVWPWRLMMLAVVGIIVFMILIGGCNRMIWKSRSEKRDARSEKKKRRKT
ncbi:MAG: DUF916 domain-containing protein [Patescibacteria group bacterium]